MGAREEADRENEVEAPEGGNKGHRVEGTEGVHKDHRVEAPEEALKDHQETQVVEVVQEEVLDSLQDETHLAEEDGGAPLPVRRAETRIQAAGPEQESTRGIRGGTMQDQAAGPLEARLGHPHRTLRAT